MPRISGFDTSMNSWGSYSGECYCRECMAIEPDLDNEGPPKEPSSPELREILAEALRDNCPK